MEGQSIRRIGIFSDLDDDELKVITTFATVKEVPAGTVVVREGDFANRFMAIDQGEARVIRDGEEVGRLGAGDIFGEIGLIEKERRTATVEAVSDLSLIEIEHWELQRMKKVIPHVYERIERLAEERSKSA